MNRGIKRILVTLASICTALIILMSGCGTLLPAPTPEPPPAQSTQSASEKPPTRGSEPASPYTLELSFPNGAPALNQVAELKVVAIQKTGVYNDVRIDVILPEGFELISGNLTWSADSLPHGDTEVINANIKATKTGNWTIEARVYAVKSNLVFPEGGAIHPIYVAVSEDSAEWGTTRFWIQPGPVPVHPVK